MHYIGMDAVDSAGRLRARFPILDQAIYVNHASLAPWPRETLLAVRDYAERTHRYGPLDYTRWVRKANRLRTLAAQLVNAESPADISLMQNTSVGINTLANGLDWRKGDNIVIPREDFPSNSLPWQALGERGVDVRVVDTRASDRPEEALLAQMDRRTRVLAVSSVHWIDGFRLQLEKLGSACRAAGVLFFVDAIQQLGAIRVDVTRQRIDVLAAGAHKWLLGPEGMGLFYCRASVRETLKPSQLGWHMLQERLAFEAPGRDHATDGRRFEPGTPNRLGQVALLASIEVLLEYGMERIEAAVLHNSRLLSSALTSMSGVELLSPMEPDRMSGIVNFEVAPGNRQRVLKALREHEVIAIARGDGIRLSPHFYQGKEVLEALLERIELSL